MHAEALHAGEHATGVAHYIMVSSVPCLMLLRMRQPRLHQPWRLDGCYFTHSLSSRR